MSAAAAQSHRRPSNLIPVVLTGILSSVGSVVGTWQLLEYRVSRLEEQRIDDLARVEQNFTALRIDVARAASDSVDLRLVLIDRIGAIAQQVARIEAKMEMPHRAETPP